MIDKYVEEYFFIASSYSERIQTIRSILNDVRATGALFLRHDDCTNAWCEIDRKQIVEKVGTRRPKSVGLQLILAKWHHGMAAVA